MYTKINFVSAANQSKNWCFTIFNPKPDDAKSILTGSVYCVAGDEVGEEGTPHIQGFVQFAVRKRLATLKKLHSGAHWEIMMGSSDQAANYCKKGEQSHAEWKEHNIKGPNFGKNAKFVETGTFFQVARTGRLCPDAERATGKKGGLAKAEQYRKMIDLSKKGAFETMLEEFPGAYWLHYNTMKRINMDNPKEVDDLDELKNEWIWGAPGTGKSRTARLENPNFFDKSLNKDWSGYKGQPVIICDDVGKFQVLHGFGDHLKRWGDHYAFPADIKYSGAVIRPEKIIVTSNYSIEQLWVHDPELASALLRRFKVRHFVEMLEFDNTEIKKKKQAEREAKKVAASPPRNEGPTKKRKLSEFAKDAFAMQPKSSGPTPFDQENSDTMLQNYINNCAEDVESDKRGYPIDLTNSEEKQWCDEDSEDVQDTQYCKDCMKKICKCYENSFEDSTVEEEQCDIDELYQ